MKLNNKGVTLVEIIVSVALISIVLIFLFSLLIQVNNENSDNEVKSSYLVNQSAFIKQIEEDFIDYKFTDGDLCNSYGVTIYNSSDETKAKNIYLPKWNNISSNIKCLSFTLNEEPGYAHLFLYKRTDNKTILSYYRGDFKQSVELEEFDWEKNNEEATRKFDDNMYAFSLPIIGPDGKDYSINLSYYKP